MDEPALYNDSGFHASVLPILDRHGAQSRIVIVKASYAIRPGRAAALAEEQRDLRLGDEPWGVPEIPDVRLPGDFCLAKPGTDFVLSGHAVPPLEKSCNHVDVSIRVADRVMKMRVHGQRLWLRSLRGVSPGPSAPLQPTPLAWSRAYGGVDLTDPKHPLEETRNPVGSGIAHDAERLVGTPAPQIEALNEPVGAAGGNYAPVGCAPIGRHFGSRRKTMGTYDAAWLKSVYPARPTDYREEHENCAPPDFIFWQPLRGGECVTAIGVCVDGTLDFRIPKLGLLIEAEIDGAAIERRPHLDTVVLDSDSLVLELVWRALYRCPSKMHKRFTAVHVRVKDFVK